MGAVLVCGDLGVGVAYPHLSARVLTVAPDAELVASSIMTVQSCATAFGAAMAGPIINLASQPALDGTGMGPVAASRWLFGTFTLASAPMVA